MAYNGTLVETFKTQYGWGVKVNTQNGERKFFTKQQPPQMVAGTPISFDASKNEKGTWYISNIHVSGRSNGGGRPQQRQQTPPPATNDTNARMIFITGITGRAIGSGQFGLNDITPLALAAAKAYDALVGGEQQDPPMNDGLEPYGGPAEDGLDDSIPF